MNPFLKKDESIQYHLLSLMNKFLNQIAYDQIQDLHQEMLTFIDIHIQIDSNFWSQHIHESIQEWIFSYFQYVDPSTINRLFPYFKQNIDNEIKTIFCAFNKVSCPKF